MDVIEVKKIIRNNFENSLFFMIFWRVFLNMKNVLLDISCDVFFFCRFRYYLWAFLWNQLWHHLHFYFRQNWISFIKFWRFFRFFWYFWVLGSESLNKKYWMTKCGEANNFFYSFHLFSFINWKKWKCTEEANNELTWGCNKLRRFKKIN